MADVKAYTGGCHCGKFTFEASVDLGNVISCNCSIRTGVKNGVASWSKEMEPWRSFEIASSMR